MKEFFKDIFSDKITRLSFWLSLFFNLLGLSTVLFSYNKLPPFIPIFNQLPWGHARIGSTITIFIPLAASFVICIANLIFAFLLHEKVPLMSRILSVTGLITSILVFLFVIKIIILVL